MKKIMMIGAAASMAALTGASVSPKRKPTLGERAKAAAEKVASATKKVAKAVAGAKEWPFNHPHVNPYYRARRGGVVGVRATFPNGREFITRQDIGRWMPHNGAREMARRRRQMERAHAAAA